MHAHEHRLGGETNARQRAARPAARPARTAAPGPLGPDAILAMQSAAGNRAVSRILAGDREQAREEAPDRSPGVKEVLSRPGSPLAPSVREDMESRLGADFSDVRLHTGPEARSSASRIGARAYTSGSHVVIGDGGADRRTLAHELTHVLQQRQGPVDGTDNGSGLRISDPGDRFEREAEANARRVMRAAAPDQPAGAPSAPGGADVQRVAVGEDGLPVIQRWKYGTMEGKDPKYTPDNGRAGTAEVHNLKGKPLGAAANSPTVSPKGWKNLQDKGYTKKAPGGEKPIGNPYRAVRMHLFNGRLGGKGDNINNLAPGPGKINSMMSAQAEDPAKALVEQGHEVWLKTTVKYQNNSGNDQDFTSVVPNEIIMEWGVEGDPTAKYEWKADIPLPEDPLSPSKAKRYQKWTGSRKSLLKELQSAKDQVRAQVLGLVPTMKLKLAILEAYPALYRAADNVDKVGYIIKFSNAAAQVKFLKSMGVIWSDVSSDDIYTQALKPLYEEGHQPVAKEIFKSIVMTGDTGTKMRDRYGDDFIEAIGGPESGAELVEQKGGVGIIRRCESKYRMGFFNILRNRKTLGNILTKGIVPEPTMFKWLDDWAKHNKKTTSDDKVKYIRLELPAWGDTYSKKRKAHDIAESRPKRPERAAKKARYK